MKTLFPQLVRAEYLGEYRVKLIFRDGCCGEVDLQAELYGEVFAPLRDPELFAQFTVNPDLHTLVWPGGADFAPEFLHQLCAAKQSEPSPL